MLDRVEILRKEGQDWDWRFRADSLRSSAGWWSWRVNWGKARPLRSGCLLTQLTYLLRLSSPLNLFSMFGCSGGTAAAAANALAKATTLGYRLAGARESARITTSLSSGEKFNSSSPAAASLSGIGGIVRSCVNISLGALAV